MKTFFIILLLTGIGLAVALFVSPGLRQQAEALLYDTGVKSHSNIFYKWQDADGVLQYTQTPPPAGTPYEKVEARSDVNVVPVPEALEK